MRLLEMLLLLLSLAIISPGGKKILPFGPFSKDFLSPLSVNDDTKIIFLRGRDISSSNISFHSSEKRGLCLMKSSSETLQNLPYFIYYMKTQSRFFHFSFHATLIFSLMNALVFVDIEQDIHQGKIKLNEKSNFGFSYTNIKIWQILKCFAGTFHQA